MFCGGPVKPPESLLQPLIIQGQLVEQVLYLSTAMNTNLSYIILTQTDPTSSAAEETKDPTGATDQFINPDCF